MLFYFKNKDDLMADSGSGVELSAEYYDQNADAKMVSAIKDVPEPVVGVPDLQEAKRLRLKLCANARH